MAKAISDHNCSTPSTPQVLWMWPSVKVNRPVQVNCVNHNKKNKKYSHNDSANNSILGLYIMFCYCVVNGLRRDTRITSLGLLGSYVIHLTYVQTVSVFGSVKFSVMLS